MQNKLFSELAIGDVFTLAGGDERVMFKKKTSKLAATVVGHSDVKMALKTPVFLIADKRYTYYHCIASGLCKVMFNGKTIHTAGNKTEAINFAQQHMESNDNVQ